MQDTPTSSLRPEQPLETGRRFLVGTSGFRHREWRGSFYPPGLGNGELLTFYAERFGAVEIYTTLQRVRSGLDLGDWADRVPERFRFAMQAPRQAVDGHHIDHSVELMHEWLDALRALGDRLGPLLVGTRDRRPELHELQELLARLPGREHGIAVEPCDRSWVDDAALDAMSARNVALCVTDSDDPSLTQPLVATADWGYVRLRREEYTTRQLQLWARRIRDQPWGRAYIFVKHDVKGGGPHVAAQLARILAGRQSG